MTIGDKIKKRRFDLNLRQEDLAKHLGVRASTRRFRLNDTKMSFDY